VRTCHLAAVNLRSIFSVMTLSRGRTMRLQFYASARYRTLDVIFITFTAACLSVSKQVSKLGLLATRNFLMVTFAKIDN